MVARDEKRDLLQDDCGSGDNDPKVCANETSSRVYGRLRIPEILPSRSKEKEAENFSKSWCLILAASLGIYLEENIVNNHNDVYRDRGWQLSG